MNDARNIMGPAIRVEDMLEVTLPDPNSFLKVMETLTRIGIPSIKTDDGGRRKLMQSCHILHKKGSYYIVHFKELIALDGNQSNITEEDYQRRNRIAALLEEWGLVTRKYPERFDDLLPINKLKIVSYKDKGNWSLEPKYIISSSRKATN